MLATMLLGGFYISIQNMKPWIRWTQYLSFIKYTYDALLRNEFEGRTFYSSLDGIPQFGADIIESKSPAINSIVLDVVILLGFAVVFRFIAYILLKYIYKQRGYLLSANNRSR